MVALRHFEDITPGEVIQAGPIEMTREAIVAFAQMYDPQPFHLDEATAAVSRLGGLAASGWHTAAVGMRLCHDGFLRHVAWLGMPVIEELRWTRPVRPGDALSLVLAIGETRVSASQPDRGDVAVALDLRNAAGATVMTQKGPLIVRRRDAGRPGAPPAPTADPSRVAMSRVAMSRVAMSPLHAPPADLMLTATFDEIEVGHASRFGTQIFTPEAITGFAKLYDPRDVDAAAASPTGGPTASNWQTAAFWMKHYIAARRRSAEARVAAGLQAAVGGPSPGFADLEWHRPVHAGAAITYGMRIKGKRKTGRPGWGLVTTRNTGHAADGMLVFSFEGRLLWPAGT